MNDTQKKIYKFSKIMAIITKVLCISLIIGMFMPITVLTLYFIAPDTNFTATQGLGFYSMTGLLLGTTGEVIAEMWTIIASGSLVFFVLLITYRIFKSISMNIIPFSQKNAERFKKIGVLLLAYSIVEPVSRMGFYSIFAPENKMQSSLNIVSIIIALIFFFIAILFDYGAELQRLSDETL